MEWWFIMARRVSVERGRGRNKSKNKITKQKKTKKNFNGERIVGWVDGWEENWSVMHTFSFLSNPLYIALFPTIQQDTTTTTEDMAVVLWAYLELFFSNLSLSRDAITTVVDQSLKSLRIVSYFCLFFISSCAVCSMAVPLLLGHRIFFFYMTLCCCSSVPVCCWCVILYSMYHCLFFSLSLLFVSPMQDPVSLFSPRYIISCSVQYIVQLIQHGVSKHFSILAIISYIRFHLTLSLIRWGNGVVGRKAADDSAAVLPFHKISLLFFIFFFCIPHHWLVEYKTFGSAQGSMVNVAWPKR